MKIFIESKNQTKTLQFKGTVIELLRHLKINKESVIVVRTDELITEDELILNTDSIKILSVISGG